MFGFVWLRATLPRLKYDRLMRLGWQVLIPLAVLNLVVTWVVVAVISLGIINKMADPNEKYKNYLDDKSRVYGL